MPQAQKRENTTRLVLLDLDIRIVEQDASWSILAAKQARFDEYRMLTNACARTQHHTTQHKEVPTNKLGMLGRNDPFAENMVILLLDCPS